MKCIIQAISDHETELLAFLHHKVTDQIIAEDLLQEIKLRAVQQGHNFCVLVQPRAWLYRVARNLVIDYYRKQKSTQELPTNLAQQQDAKETIDLLTECVSRNLSRLTSADKSILEHCGLNNNTVNSYAELHNISLSAAKARLHRAREHLKASIEYHCKVKFDDSGSVCCYRVPN